MYTDFFKGKRVTVMGLGLLGRGVGDVRFIAEHGGTVTVTDKKNKETLAESVTALEGIGVAFHLGEHDLKDFTDTDMVIKAAGVPLDSREIAAARAANVPVYMSTALFTKFAMEIGAKIVGVTGTRGKTTVAHMIHHVLVHAGKHVHLGGNIRGLSTLAMLPDVRSGDICVLELDSWQLQGFGDLEISPNIAIFTNLMPDHQNYYPSMQAYLADKAEIFLHQSEGDFLLMGKEASELIYETYLRKLKAQRYIVHGANIRRDWQLHVPGEHNRMNAAYAYRALRLLDISDEEIKSGLESFTGVEGRLQFVRELNGVRIYNDNNATTPEATIAAIRALDEGKKNIVLIMGGSDKGLDMNALWEEVRAKCKDLYFLSGTGTDRIRSEAPHVPAYDSLHEAVDAALKGTSPGDILLFSPAFASFGMFKNEYDRNDQFMRMITSL
jgi:UDP-N-acetylmuramoylalanine--D-glutamate ligase